MIRRETFRSHYRDYTSVSMSELKELFIRERKRAGGACMSEGHSMGWTENAFRRRCN